MLLFLSYTSILVAILYQQATHYRKIQYSIFSIFLFLSLLNNLIYIIIDHFSGNGIDTATIYLLSYGLEGTGFGEYTPIYFSAVVYLVLTIFILYTIYKRQKKALDTHMGFSILSIAFILLSIVISPTVKDVYTYYKTQAISEVQNTDEPQLTDTEQQTIVEHTFSEYYITPTITSTTTSKNLVFIYVEGLENNYSNKEIFPNLTPNLDRLTKQATNFTRIKQLDNTGYTIAGMVASQCGVPLVAPSQGNTLQGIDSFLPGATCLGDLLHSVGYHLAYYGGASLSFAGKGSFYTTHKYNEVYGKNELSPYVTDQKDISSWGIHDDTLLPLISKAYDNLSSSSTPFLLNFITLETHHPSGVHSKDCEEVKYGNGKNKLLNAVHCSDQMIGTFVDHILNSPNAKNTIIVIASDHLGLPSDTTKLLNKTSRFNRFTIIDPSNLTSTQNNIQGSTLDITPTILPFIGFSSDVGFGRNLLSPSTTQEQLNILQITLPKWYKDIKLFWQFPTVKNNITIDTSTQQLHIDNRTFLLPALVTLDKELHSTLFFRFNQKEPYELLAYIDSDAKDLDFYLVERCNVIKKYAANKEATAQIPDTDQYCLANGNTTITNVSLLTTTTILKKEDLQK